MESSSQIKLVGVIGSGIMGSGIAEVISKSGIDVVVRSRSEQTAQATKAAIEASLNKQLAKGGLIRRLTEVECERLQTVPDNYTDKVSSTQRYRMLGNGWTVDVIVHILKHLKI